MESASIFPCEIVQRSIWNYLNRKYIKYAIACHRLLTTMIYTKGRHDFEPHICMHGNKCAIGGPI